MLHPRALFGASDWTGDPSLNLWALGWNLGTLTSHPSWLATGRIFDANIFFPARHTLAYSDHLILQSLALWPVYAATRDVVLCYNVLLIASLVAAAASMHVLAREVVGREDAAFVAGLVFGFAPYHLGHLTHIQLQALYFMPWSFLLLVRLFRRDRAADTVTFGLVMGLQTVASAYYGIIGAIGIAVAAVVLAVAGRRLLDWRLLRRGAVAVVVAGAVALPWMVPYLRVQRETGAGRTLLEAAQASAVPASYVQAPPTNLLYGRTGWLTPVPPGRLARKDGPEQALFPGFVTMALAGIALLTVWTYRRRHASDAPRGALPPGVLASVCLAVGGVGLLLSFGPDGVRPLYVGLYRVLVGMEAIRATARFSVLVLVALALLAALAVARWRPRAPWLPALACLLVGVEFLNGSIEFPPRPSLTSPAGAWLAAQPGTGAVLCLPIGLDRESTSCMLQSLEHRRPIVNGYSGIRPPFYSAVVDAVSRMPSVEALNVLHDIGVQYVVSASPIDLPPLVAGALVERARFGDTRVYETVWSDALVEQLGTDAGPPPDAPGPVPFALGESATYRVRWTNGPMNVPAGEMTIGVAPPRGDEAFRFVASAKTAPWVARFFQTTAALETTAGAGLLPLTHVETIDDGKHVTERRVAYDFAGRHVRMTNGGASLALPLLPAARDPLAALFYVRTLPFETGRTFTLPLTDNGRPSRLEVTVGALETVVVDGHTWSAWKVEPRIRQRVERQTPLAITTWVSADARRVPILIDVAAGFGAVRAELVAYQAR